jgi:SpoVK/Ycf46/Vps4 family AAA+-type ATPase
MAKAELITKLITYASMKDETNFKRAVEAIIADERAKQHHVLADKLTEAYNLRNKISNKQFQNTSEDNEFVYFIQPKKQFSDLILDCKILKIFQDLVTEHFRSELLSSYGLSPRNRVLLAGSPGNGKTSLAEAIAYELSYPLIIVRYEKMIGSYLGETANRLRKVMEYASSRKCVLFFDEFETIGKERGDNKETGEIKRVVSSLLMQIDRLPSYVVVVTASNHPELLDRAVWRRFQIKVGLEKPDKALIKDYLCNFEEKSKMLFDFSKTKISTILLGLSYAEVEEFCLDVMRKSVLDHRFEDNSSIVSEVLKQLELKYSIQKETVDEK